MESNQLNELVTGMYRTRAQLPTIKGSITQMIECHSNLIILKFQMAQNHIQKLSITGLFGYAHRPCSQVHKYFQVKDAHNNQGCSRDGEQDHMFESKHCLCIIAHFLHHFYFPSKKRGKKRVFATKTTPSSLDPAFANLGDIQMYAILPLRD